MAALPPFEASRPPVSGGEASAVALLIAFLLLSRLHSYILFHSLVELFGIAVVLTAFSLAWNTRRHLEDAFLRVAGLALGPVALVTTLHALAYKGMGVFPEADANLPTQLWIAMRLLQAAGMVAATLPAVAAVPAGRVVGAATAAALAAIALVFSGLFPDCYVDGKGLTPFKIGAEYVVMAAFAVAAARLLRDPAPRDPRVRRLAVTALVAGALEGAAFTLYVDVYGAMNMTGHVLGLASALLIYAAVAWVGLSLPQEALYARQRALREHFARRAESANRDILQFAEVLAHHLQEPIRQQHVFSQRLARLMPAEAMSDSARESLRIIMEGAIRQRALLRDVVLFLAAAAAPPPAGLCSAERALDAALARLRPRIAESGATLHRAPLPQALVDEERLADLFGILIDNAIAFARPGVPPLVRVAAERRGHDIEFSVDDNGIGIPEEFRTRVFRFFERLSPTPRGDQTGIGLPLAKKIVETAGGSIWIADSPDGGVSVRFRLATR